MKTQNLPFTPGKHRMSRRPAVPQREAHSESRILNGVRSARLLLSRHIRRQPRSVAVPLPAELMPSAATVAPPLAHLQERVMQRAATTTLKGRETSVTHHKPLMSRSEVAEILGMDVGALQAVIYAPGAQQPLLHFDRSTRDAHGKKKVNFAFMTPDQLMQVHTAQMAGEPVREELKESILRMTHREHRVVGQKHGLPGIHVRRVYDIDGALVDPALQGEVELFLYQTVDGGIAGNLHIRDLDSKQGTVVQYNPEMVPSTDPWAEYPMHPTALQDAYVH